MLNCEKINLNARCCWCLADWLISHFYIKPQLGNAAWWFRFYWLISHFYIKPQPPAGLQIRWSIDLYLISTSNHNWCLQPLGHTSIDLYLISTSNHNLLHQVLDGCPIDLYLISTSNHNKKKPILGLLRLTYISFLHQTTTAGTVYTLNIDWLISHFYIKPQLRISTCFCGVDWLISHFYIKPQLSMWAWHSKMIDLYLISTSNHNHEA